MKNERELDKIKTPREIGEILSESTTPWEKVTLLLEQYGKINQADSNGSGKNLGWKSLEQIKVKGEKGSYTFNLNQAPLYDKDERPIPGQFEKSVELFVSSYSVLRTPSVMVDMIYYIQEESVKDFSHVNIIGDELCDVSRLIDTLAILLLSRQKKAPVNYMILGGDEN